MSLTFEAATADEFKAILLNSPAKKSQRDPAQTWLMKRAVHKSSPVHRWNVLCVASTIKLPSACEKVTVPPQLKKPNVDPNDPASYRPISNLSFLSQVVEKIVDARLSEHVCRHRLLPVVKSAYRPYHSTETAVVRVLNDMIKVTSAFLYSCVLNSVDHTSLLDIERRRFRICDRPLHCQSSCPGGSILSGSIRQTLTTSLNCEASLKDLYSDRSGLLSAPKLFRPVSSSIDYASTCTRMICRVYNIVNRPRLIRLCPAFSSALKTSAAGARRSASSSTPAKRKCCGSALLHSFAKYPSTTGQNTSAGN